jgi:membrane-bound lytic murein transglycosylase B
VSTRVATALLLVALVAGGPAPAVAQEGVPGATTVTVADISPALDDVEVDSPAYRAVAEDYEAARAARQEAAARLATLAVQERDLAERSARAGAAARLARLDVTRWGRRVALLAQQAYMGAVDDDAVAEAGLDPTYTEGERRALVTEVVDAQWRSRLASAREALATAEREQARLTDEHEAVVADQVETERARAESRHEELRLWPTVQGARATAIVVGSDLTLVALDAYLRAALDMGTEMPGCGIPWWLLAGIGRVESGHGTFSTSVLDPAGTTSPPIIGIPLNGGNSTAVITDTDGGVLDGDTTHDRAVGPMQFIPSTWAPYAADGNGDGVADPQNLYDAARAAATYLCTAGGDLSTPAGIDRAIFAYNHSDAYVAKVLGFTREYLGLLV